MGNLSQLVQSPLHTYLVINCEPRPESSPWAAKVVSAWIVPEQTGHRGSSCRFYTRCRKYLLVSVAVGKYSHLSSWRSPEGLPSAFHCTLISPTFSRKPASVSHHAFPSAQFLVLHISLTLHNTIFCVLQLISCNLHFHILTKTLRQTRGRSFCPSNPTQYWPWWVLWEVPPTWSPWPM